MAVEQGFDGWRRYAANGVVATAVSMGMRQALDPKDEEAAIVRQAEDELFRPPRAVDVYIYWGRPKETWAVVRPWLLRGEGRGA